MRLAERHHEVTYQTPVERANELIPDLTTKRRERISCPSPDHEDRNPSCDLFPDGFKCWSCGTYGDKLDYYCLINGLSTRDALEVLGAFDGTRAPRRPQRPRYSISKEIARGLVANGEFARHWHLAKLLALPPRLQAQRDLLASWDYLLGLGYDVPLVWKLSGLVRGEAWLRFGDASRATDPAESGRAVVRLLRDLERGDAA